MTLRENSPRRRRTIIGLLGAVGVILVAAIAFAVVNLAGGDPPPPLYTPAALPEVPPDPQNGWALLRDAPPPPSARADEARARAVKALSAKTSLADFAGSRVEADGAMSVAVDRCRMAYRAPRFVDACPMAALAPCPHVAIRRCHGLLIHEALAETAAGREVEAVALADRILAASIEHAQTGRGLLGQTVGLRDLEDSLELLERLRDWLPPETSSVPLKRLAAFDVDSLRIELALVGEYLVMTQAFAEMKHASAKERWLFDVRATRELVDRAFQDAAQGAPLVIPPQAHGPLWWFHNPVGKTLLDALAPTGHAWDEVRARAQSIREKRAALLGR